MNNIAVQITKSITPRNDIGSATPIKQQRLWLQTLGGCGSPTPGALISNGARLLSMHIYPPLETRRRTRPSLKKIGWLVGWLVRWLDGFLMSSSATRLFRERVPRLTTLRADT